MNLIRSILLVYLPLLCLPIASEAIDEKSRNIEITIKNTRELTAKGQSAMANGETVAAYKYFTRALSTYINGDLVSGSAYRKEIDSGVYRPAVEGVMECGHKLALAEEDRDVENALLIYQMAADTDGILKLARKHTEVFFPPKNDKQSVAAINKWQQDSSIVRLGRSVHVSGEEVESVPLFVLRNDIAVIKKRYNSYKKGVAEVLKSLAENRVAHKLKQERKLFSDYSPESYDEMATNMKYASASINYLEQARSYLDAVKAGSGRVKERAEKRGDTMLKARYYDTAIKYYEMSGSKNKLAQAQEEKDRQKSLRKNERDKFMSSFKNIDREKQKNGTQSEQEANAEADDFADELGLDL